MTRAVREQRPVQAPALLVGASAWVMLVFEPGDHAGPAHGSPGSPVVAWLLMLAAMMSPLLIAPVRHVRDRSFALRRVRAVALFLTGATGVWAAAGVVLLAVSGMARTVPFAVAVAVLGAIVWQSSPAKQRCLNRVHAHPELAAFGTAADLDALRFGVTHSAWCVGSCWALMMLPLMVSSGHLAVMATVTLWLAAERLDRPMPLRWRLRGPRKAVRLAVARLPPAPRWC